MKDIDDTPLVVIEYALPRRVLALLFRLFGVYFGALLIIADSYLFLSVIGWIIFMVMMFRFMDMLLFERALITNRYFIKKWYLIGALKLSVSKLQCRKSETKLGGTLLFDEKGKKGQSLFFSIDILPLDREKIKEIKEALIDLGVISKDEKSWLD